MHGMVNLMMNVVEEVWKKCICERIQEVGREAWTDWVNNIEREKEHVRMKECPRRDSFAYGSVGAKVRMMVRGGCLPVRGSGTIKWKYQDYICGCGPVETDCMQSIWTRARTMDMNNKKIEDGMCEYEVIKEYHVEVIK